MASRMKVESAPRVRATKPLKRKRQSLRLRISERRVLLMFGDVVATGLSVALGLYFWSRGAHKAFTPEFIIPQLHWFLLLPSLWVILASANNYYNLHVSANLKSSLARLILVLFELLLVYLATFFLSPRGSLPRRFIIYYAIISLVLTALWRAARLFLVGWTGFRRRVIIVGVGRAAEMLWRAMQEEAVADYEVIGCVSSAHDLATLATDIPILGTGEELPRLVEQYDIAELLMAYINEVPDDVFVGAMTCYEQGVEIVPMPTLYEQITGRIPIEHVGEHLWTLVLPTEGRTFTFNIYLTVKRIVDIIFAVIGLIVFAVLLPVLVIAIKLDSPGPIFYRQLRLGQGGYEFMVYKLRTMVDNAEQESGPRWSTVGDRRVTRVGRILRKSRLDEVPQLWNVVRSEMSIVGPRPERPELIQLLVKESPYYRARLAVKPGLTGWAQVRFRYGSSVGDSIRKLQYDLYYIRRQSLALDLMIMVRTIGTMLTFKGT